MGALVDSSVLIAAERGQLGIDKVADLFADEDLALSAVTATELLHGIHRVQNTPQRTRRQAFIEGLLAAFPVIAFDLTIARVHASLWAELAGRGALVGERDLMIGATAIAIGFSIVTRDRRSFSKIPLLVRAA